MVEVTLEKLGEAFDDLCDDMQELESDLAVWADLQLLLCAVRQLRVHCCCGSHRTTC